ncbi:CTP synthase, partial [Candidatus Saccharibacteria bacterium 32-49-10]
MYVPFIQTSKEFKSKPAQNALHELRGFGIMPDCVVVRTDEPAPTEIAAKIARFSGISDDAVILLSNAHTVYEVPLTVYASGIGPVLDRFTGNTVKPDLSKWRELAEAQETRFPSTVKIGMVAKYLDNEDTYISVLEALKAAAWSEKVNLDLSWVDAEDVSEGDLGKLDGILVPGGFGKRGIDGKIAAARYALDAKKPYLGLCLGLQVAVIAAARKGGLDDADSTEFTSDTKQDVVYIMEGQAGKESTGGTLRLGDYEAVLTKGSKAAEVYGSLNVTERHRHRYEVNQKFTTEIEAGGLTITGTSPDKKLVEYVEAADHPYFVATQAHPEFKSRPSRPHPLFVGLIRAA